MFGHEVDLDNKFFFLNISKIFQLVELKFNTFAISRKMRSSAVGDFKIKYKNGNIINFAKSLTIVDYNDAVLRDIDIGKNVKDLLLIETLKVMRLPKSFC